jgi:hypothetical protein
MSTHRLATAELVRLFDTGSLSGLSEWQLLERFVAHRDELAFQVEETKELIEQLKAERGKAKKAESR